MVEATVKIGGLFQMMKMLIVDDERLDREGIAYLIRQYKYPIECYMAASVNEAIEILNNTPIDVLFTDICMPGKDGIELIRLALDIKPDVVSVIYSAYGEFSYAQKAIKYGVTNYILKPMQADIFKETIDKLLDDYEKSKHTRRREQLERLLTLELNDKNFDWDVSGDLILISFSDLVFKEENYERIKNEIEICFNPKIWTMLNNCRAVLIVDKELEDEKSQLFIEKTKESMGIDANVVISREIRNQEDILSAYHDAENVLESILFDVQGTTIYTEKNENSVEVTYTDQIQALENSIRYGAKIKAISCVETLFEDIKSSGAISTIYLKYISSNIIRCCIAQNQQLSQKQTFAYVEKILGCNDVDKLRQLILEMIDAVMIDGGSDNSVTNQVIDIVEKEYMYDIGLQQIADRVNRSPSYLSFYFKKNTGHNFVKYLTIFRLEKAKEMLKNTDIKIVTISEMVGYTNSSYFCMLFKNYTGMTPAQYREKE